MAMSLLGASTAPPIASLSLGTSGSSKCRLRSLVVARVTSSSSPTALLRSSFVAAPSSSSSLSSSFAGMSLGMDFGLDKAVPRKRCGLVVRAGKYTLCQTKRNRSHKSLARVHGFRRRMRTISGRAVLKRRRAKGRKVLCPKSNTRGRG